MTLHSDRGAGRARTDDDQILRPLRALWSPFASRQARSQLGTPHTAGRGLTLETTNVTTCVTLATSAVTCPKQPNWRTGSWRGAEVPSRQLSRRDPSRATRAGQGTPERGGSCRRLFSPSRGLWVAIPAKYRTWGAPPAVEFVDQLLTHLERDYYVGWLSAAEIHAPGRSEGIPSGSSTFRWETSTRQ